MKRCMYCGHMNDDASETCVQCGNQLLNMPVSEENATGASGFSGVDAGTDKTGQQTYGQDGAGQIPGGEGAVSAVPGSGSADAVPVQQDVFTQAAQENAQSVLPQQEMDIPAQDLSEAITSQMNQEHYAPTDVLRGQTYASSVQHDPMEQPLPYGGQDYNYGAQPQAGQQYNGAAYGYGQDGINYGGSPYGYPQGDYGQNYGQNYGQPDGGYYAAQDTGAGRIGAIAQLKEKARKRVKSPLMFLAALFFSVHVIANILNIVMGSALINISTVVNTVEKQAGADTMVIDYLKQGVDLINKTSKIILVAGGLIIMIPTILKLLGLWIAFASTSKDREDQPTAGFTLFKTGVIFNFIGTCVAEIGLIMLAVVFVVSAGAASSMMSLILGIIVLLILILFTVFSILYYLQVLFGIKVVKINCRDGEDIGKIPGFAIFVGLLLCVVTIAGMLPMAPDDYIGLVAQGSAAAWLLFISLWAIVYRGTVKVK